MSRDTFAVVFVTERENERIKLREDPCFLLIKALKIGDA